MCFFLLYLENAYVPPAMRGSNDARANPDAGRGYENRGGWGGKLWIFEIM